MGYLLFIIRVRQVHDPDVVSAITIRCEGKESAVGTVLWLNLPGMSA